MQTIIGANGQIDEEIARELKRSFTSDIRIVSRNARKINDSDSVVSTDMTVKEQAIKAFQGSTIVYFALGLPMNSAMWEEQESTIGTY